MAPRPQVRGNEGRLMAPIELIDAATAAHADTVRELFREYAAWLQVDLCYQGFEHELATLPGLYAPPRGRLYLARSGAAVAACICLRPLNDDDGEIKRLYVRPAFRKSGLGRRLVNQLVDDARRIGFRRIVLDTLDWMTDAIRLYESLGFRATQAYRPPPRAQVNCGDNACAAAVPAGGGQATWHTAATAANLRYFELLL